jgi:hypothetical protein
MRTLLKLSVLALSVAVALGDNDNNNGRNGRSNCPAGLNCKSGKVFPHPQGMGYAGNGYDQNAIGYALFSIGNPAILAGLPNVGLDYEAGIFATMGSYAMAELAALETPFFIRGATHLLACAWNSQTYFIREVQPVLYEPSVNFPYSASRVITPVFNTTRNRNLAVAYAVLRISEYLTPKGVVVPYLLSQFGINTTYRGVSNLQDARDIGNIAAAAVIAKLKGDNWNSESSEYTYWKHPYSDYTEFIPANDAYELKNIAKWQPLMETKEDGSFVVQTHVTAQLQAEEAGFAVTKGQMNGKYRVKNNKLPFQHDGSDSDPLTAQELNFLKTETDLILQASANLDDTQKMVAQFFDTKALSFGYMPINSVVDFGYTFMRTLALDLGYHLAIWDATLVAWNEKMRINAVRPVSTVRYFYGNTKVNAYAGPYQGTKLMDGSDWNSFLRTMPHSDFPSGTACICVAFAEYVERFRGTPGFVNLRWDFMPGSSMREPGVTPAAPISKTWTTTQEFINECSYSRLHAGVHFNSTITATIDFCEGLGAQAFNKWYDFAKGVL